MKYLLLFISLFLSASIEAANYPEGEADCDGYPQAMLGTVEGACVGIIAQPSTGANWTKPRRIIQIPSTQQFIVTDMGGWTRGKGIVWLLDASVKPAKLSVLIQNLKLPHGLEIGPDGLFYVGEADRIFRFRVRDNKAVEVETIIRDLPDFPGHNHPLTHFIFDHQDNLIVNVGAPSDQCADDKQEVLCSEVNTSLKTHAAVRRYPYNVLMKRWSHNYEVVASGLRNSMALASHSSGTLLQAENSIDLEELERPFEEINRIDTGGFFGWPYCYDNDKVNRLWPTYGRKICADSEQHKQPWVLMPAHTAPLDMRYYSGEMFPELEGRLLISWHGYRRTGRRLVSYAVDRQGLPLRKSPATYNVDPEAKGQGDGENDNTELTQHQFPMTVSNTAQAREIITRMNAVGQVRPRGRPAGMTVAEDGSIWLLDDINKSLLRLAKGEAYEDVAVLPAATTNYVVKDAEVSELLLKRCQSCHNLTSDIEGIAIPEAWLVKEAGTSLLAQRVFNSPMRPMPPTSPLTDEQQSILRKWLSAM